MNHTANPRLWVADMFTYNLSMKAQGLKPYYIEGGELKPLLVSRCRNQWGIIYFLTDAEYEKAKAVEDIVTKMRQAVQRQLELAQDLLASSIVHNIIPQQPTA